MNNKHITLIGSNNLLADKLKASNYFVEQFGRNTELKLDFTDNDIDQQIDLLLTHTSSNVFIIFILFPIILLN